MAQIVDNVEWSIPRVLPLQMPVKMPYLELSTTSERGVRQRGPALKVRRYGRNDFEKFNEDTARGSHLRVGHGAIGKVDIDCKYHWSKAQWGTLGPNKHPGGIMYMDITFKQPHGCWLERASVHITLSEDTASYALDVPRRSGESSRKSARSLEADYAVQIREYGPSCIIGTKTTGEKTVKTTAKPSIGATGLGEVSGMGRESGFSMEVSDRWVFQGTRCRPGGGDGIRTLEWELKENQMDPNQVHNREYKTAFAFEHSQRPVFMRVEVEGELSSKRQKLKHKFATFSSNFGKEDKSTLTRMDFNRARVFEKSLDNVAKGLDMAMQYENSRNLAVEMPGPMQAKFSEDGLPPIDGQQEAAPGGGPECDGPERLEASSKEEALLRGLRDQLDDRRPSSTSPSIATTLVE
ncbi:hypothetical protein IMZ48_41535, partial [Candidatus Bathyarchaeota archaeon]|nr:hypothetical protein [Candidatus Bathyarchaeota archaeon]